MKTLLPNTRAYDAAGSGDHSLFSPEHCCVCGKPIGLHSTWLLLTRAADGACEYAISRPDDATVDEIKSGMWLAPIGPDCLRKHPELKHAVLDSDTSEIRRLRALLEDTAQWLEASAFRQRSSTMLKERAKLLRAALEQLR
jgi:hypothetical protein